MKKLLLLLTCLLLIANAAAAEGRGGHGKLDPSFGAAGRVVRPVVPGLTGTTEAAQAPSGRIYVLCRGALFAFRSNGRPDPAFGQDGTVVLATLLPEVKNPEFAVDSKGRVVVAGTDRVPEGDDRERPALARLLPDGRLDPSFGSGGLVITDLGLGAAEQPESIMGYPEGPGVYVQAASISIDPLDRISLNLSHVVRFEWHVERDLSVLERRTEWVSARFGPNGEIDRSYDEGGVRTTPPLPDYEHSLPAPDGSAYATTRARSGDLYAVRFSPTGNLDSSFGSDGWRRLPDAGETTATVDGRSRLVILQSAANNGKRVIAVRRLLPDGRLDRSFGRRGVFRASFGAGPEVPMVASDHHGGLFLAAEWARRKSETSRAKGGFLIAHLTAGGELDRDFGRIETGFGRNTKAMLSSLWVDRRGRPLVAGLIESPLLAGRWGVAITRYRVPR